jgi:uncharacterized protein with HEPN domain
MGNGFSVEARTLQALAGQLRSIGETVSGAQGGLGDLGDGQTGDRDLSSAVHDFKDKWEYSLKKIGETAQAVSEKVKSAGEGYETVDTGVADAAAGRT